MIDIDHFKNVNDTYTHVAGDEVLREVARVLQTRLRKFDVLGRVGGDEFLCVLPGTADVGAMTTSERIRVRVTELRFEISAPDTLRILEKGEQTECGIFTTTVSIGVATLHNGIENTTELVRASDVALYAAKDAGRNKVMLAEQDDGSC
jgi:diguanylate cyclase (GGDEF)-like protein